MSAIHVCGLIALRPCKAKERTNSMLKQSLIGVGEFRHRVMDRDVIAVYILISAMLAVGISFSTPVYTVFLLSFGLTPVIMNRVNTWFMLANVGLEIPTGVFGDVYGHRKSVIAGLIFWSMGTAVYGLSTALPGFLLAETLAAFGGSFISGSFEAWMVNARKEEQLAAHANVQIVSKAATILGLPIVTLIADQYGLQVPWFLGSGVLAVTAVAAWWLMVEVAEPRSDEDSSLTFWSATRQSIVIALGHPVARILILGSGFSTLAFQGINMFWAPLFEGHWGVAPLGAINAGINLALLVGSQLAKRWWKQHYGIGPTVAMLWVVVTLLVGLLIGGPSILLVGFLLHEVGRGILNPLYKKLLNEHVPDRIRASTLSVASMSDKAFAALGLEISGRLATQFSFQTAWTVALVPIALAAILFFIAHKSNGKH